MSQPKIDKRSREEIIEELRAYTPYYVPEFDISESRGTGIALVTIFANMLKLLIDRLNKVPEKNFIAFLDMLGAQLLPPLPSKAPITFTLAEGTKEHVSIPARTQVAAGDVVFETRKNILASPAKFVKAYCITSSTDTIFESPPQVLTPEPVVPFHTTLLYTANKGADTIFVRGAEGLEENDVVSLGEKEYGIVAKISENKIKCSHRLEGDHHAEERVEKVTSFELFEGKNLQEHLLYAGHEDIFNLNGRAFLPLLIKPVLKGLLATKAVNWEYWGEDDEKQIGWHNLTVNPVLERMPEILAQWVKEKEGEFILLEKGTEGEVKKLKLAEKESRWIRCRVTGDLSEESPLALLSLDNILVASLPWFELSNGPSGILPEIAFCNDIPLDLSIDETSGEFKKHIYPFGKRPRILDTFYIGSREAFSKKGATITLKFSLTHEHDVPVKRIHGIGEIIAKKLEAAHIYTADDLLNYTPEQVAAILGTKQIKTAINILEAAKKAFYDKTLYEPNKDEKEGTTGTKDQEELTLSWEYWNGSGWVVLNGLIDNTDRFLERGERTVTFPCPSDLEPTEVTGQENHWIRVRIVSGDYGKEKFVPEANGTWRTDISLINPPGILKLTIAYAPSGQPLHYCLTRNNLDFKDVTEESRTEGKPFKPFKPLEDEHQTLYLGFDALVEKGPISLFVSIEEQPWSSDKIPRLEWEYYSTRRKWMRLDVLDDTRGLTRTGLVEFAFPQDCQTTEKFGAELFWIRAVDVEDSFKPIKSIYAQLYPEVPELKEIKPLLSQMIIKKYLIPGLGLYGPHTVLEKHQSPSQKYQPAPPSSSRSSSPIPKKIAAGNEGRKHCDEAVSERTACTELLEVFQPGWQHPDAVKEEILSPKIAGIFLNTTWAVQAETVDEELVGSSDGTGGQRFSLAKTPVISESVWVNELGSILEEERKALLENAEVGTREERDEEGKVTEFWVKWQPVVDLLASAKDERHYELDRISGELKFGDGIHGKVPPIGTDNIVASYCSGGGSKGNKDAFVIKDLKSSIPFVDKVFNPLAALGGTDVETTPETLERAPHVLKHRNRAVTAEDFEQLALQASRDVAKAKCLPHFDNHGHFTPGWVTVLLIPESSEERPKLSLQLRRQVEEYLRERSANTVIEENHLQVVEPVFVEASVSSTLMATAIDRIPEVEREVLRTLRAFLHPLTGGYGGKGWDFGRLPCLSDFYALLEGIEGVDHVKSITIELRTSAEDTLLSTARLSSDSSVVEMPPYAILCSGEHTIAVTYEPPRRGG